MADQGLKTELRHILERHQGRDRAVTGLELARMLNQRDDRKIRQLILELIREGLPVASATSTKRDGDRLLPPGYFIAVTWAEKREYEGVLQSRLVEDAYRKKYFKRAAGCHLDNAVQSTQVRLI